MLHYSNAIRAFQDAFAFLEVESVGCVHASCGPAGEVKKNPTALKAAERLGARLAQP